MYHVLVSLVFAMLMSITKFHQKKKETEIVQRQVQTKEMNAKLCKCIPFTSLEILRTLASFQNLNKSVIQEHILADWK